VNTRYEFSVLLDSGYVIEKRFDAVSLKAAREKAVMLLADICSWGPFSSPRYATLTSSDNHELVGSCGNAIAEMEDCRWRWYR
jgi:hypothetical protein